MADTDEADQHSQFHLLAKKTYGENVSETDSALIYDPAADDAMIDDLSSRQFDILSWIACGKSNDQTAEILMIDEDLLQIELVEIKNIFEVTDIKKAAILYSTWIDDFERESKEKRGF